MTWLFHLKHCTKIIKLLQIIHVRWKIQFTTLQHRRNIILHIYLSIYIYSETCITRTLRTLLSVCVIKGVRLIQVYLFLILSHTISLYIYIFKQTRSQVLSIRLMQVSLYIYIYIYIYKFNDRNYR